MFSTDQTHLRRYFATLGVAIAAGTLSLAGLFLKLEQDLLVTKSALANLTPAARGALLSRQQYLSVGTAILPWFVMVGFLGGVGLSVYGLIGWSRVIDEREDIGLHRERVELRQLTDVEKADKLDREAEESAGKPSPDSPQTPETNFRNVRTEIANLETALLEKLRELYPGGPGNVLSPVNMRTPAGQNIELDAMVSQAPRPPIIFELKYASSARWRSVSNRIVDGLQQLVRATTITNARGVLLVIVSDDATSTQIEQWNARATQMGAEYQSVINAYVGRYSDFLDLPASAFAAQLGLPPQSDHD
jgi:hypothetical protein